MEERAPCLPITPRLQYSIAPPSLQRPQPERVAVEPDLALGRAQLGHQHHVAARRLEIEADFLPAGVARYGIGRGARASGDAQARAVAGRRLRTYYACGGHA